jgi:uncharacterized protein
MKTRVKSAFFLGLVFAFSWPVLISGWFFGLRDPAEAGLLALAYAACPGLSAIFCVVAFERGRRCAALGLRFRPNIWWLWAALIPLLVVLSSIALTVLLSSIQIGGMDAIASEAGRVFELPENRELSGITGKLVVNLLGYSVLFTLTEELGWRGYLYALWRPFGFWRTSLSTGLVWGVWHWPMIYLYGLNYPNAPIIGIAVFPIYTMLSACLMTVVRDRGGSVWAAGIMHGGNNTFPLLFLISLGDLRWPWGIAGVGGLLTLGAAVAAIWCAQSNDKTPIETLPTT